MTSPQPDDPPTRGGRQFLRQHGAAAGGLLAALLLVVVGGPAIAQRIGDDLQQDPVAEPLPELVEPVTSDAPVTTPVTADPAVDIAPTTPNPTTATVPATTVATPTTMAEAQTIQTVPAVRDVIIDVGGEQYATDENGAVALTGAPADAAVRVVGTVADPPIQTVEFAMWGDGSTEAERPLGDIAGPVAEIGLQLSSRVRIDADVAMPAGATATFTSELGPVEVPLAEPTWVLATVPVESADGIEAMDVSYALDGLSTGTPPAGQDFRPTPEATWLIRT